MKTKLYYSALLAIFIFSGCTTDKGLLTSSNIRVYSYLNSGDSHFIENNYELALADYNKAIKINPENYHAYLHRAALYKEQKEYDLALRDYSEAIKIDPKEQHVYWNRAALYKQLKEYDLALRDYSEAIKIDPKEQHVYWNRAELYKQQKEYDLALRDYSEAIKIDPEGHQVYWNRAELYKQQKEYDLALADINKAIELNPSSMYYKVRGSVYYMKKQYDSAIQEYVKAIKLDNNYAAAYNSLAWLLATCTDKKYRNGLKAIEYAKKAVDLDPESQMFDTLAAAYAEAGDFDMALKSQEKAIQLLKEEGRSDNLDGFEKRLESYKRDIPWTEIL